MVSEYPLSGIRGLIGCNNCRNLKATGGSPCVKKSPIEVENHHVQDLVKVSWRVQISCMRVLQVYLVNKIQGEDSSFFNLTFCFKKNGGHSRNSDFT